MGDLTGPVHTHWFGFSDERDAFWEYFIQFFDLFLVSEESRPIFISNNNICQVYELFQGFFRYLLALRTRSCPQVIENFIDRKTYLFAME